MKKRTYKLKHMAGAFLAGAMLFSGFSLAAANSEGAVDAIKHTMSKISYYVNGKDQSTPAGQFTIHEPRDGGPGFHYSQRHDLCACSHGI